LSYSYMMRVWIRWEQYRNL